jgi:hypothetical protein
VLLLLERSALTLLRLLLKLLLRLLLEGALALLFLPLLELLLDLLLPVHLPVTAGSFLQGAPFSLTLHAEFLGRQALRLGWWRVALSLRKRSPFSGLAFSQTTVRILLLQKGRCAWGKLGRRSALGCLRPCTCRPGDTRSDRTEQDDFALPFPDFRTAHRLW